MLQRIQRTMAKRQGFTLIELMIVVVIIGVLAMVAVPAFIRFVRRSKTSEAASLLGGLYDGAQTYYQTEQWTQGLLTGGGSRSASVHCTVPSATTGNVVDGAAGESKSDVSSAVAASLTFSAINFSVSAPIYYRYDVTASPATSTCGVGTLQSVYTFSANGNLDGDDDLSLFEMAVGTNEENTLYHAPGLYRFQELE